MNLHSFETCMYCGLPAYKHVRKGWLCRGHFILLLEEQLGKHAPKFEAYQEAIKDWKPTPLFQQMEMKS